MIVGVGIDIVDLARFERVHTRWGDSFAGRFCAPGEVQERQGHALVQHLGGLWAAKEAVLKALGTGWAQGLGFRQVRIERSTSGRPGVRLEGAAAARAEALGVASIHLSISHDGGWAAAVAILESGNPGAPAS